MLKKESVFKRYNRENYRRILALYFPELQGKFPRKMAWPSYLYLALLPLPLLYGVFLLLLKDNKELLEAVISRSRPWLEERLQVYFPSINKVAENLAEYGYSGLIPLAQHTYAVSILFSAVLFIATAFYSWFVYVAPVRQKYLMIVRSRIAKKDLLLAFGGMILFAWLWWHSYVYEGFLEDGDCYRLECIMLFNRSSWAALWVIFMAGFTSAAVTGGIFLFYYNFKNLWQERKARNDAVAAERAAIRQRSGADGVRKL